jgi:hypothetical protein
MALTTSHLARTHHLPSLPQAFLTFLSLLLLHCCHACLYVAAQVGDHISCAHKGDSDEVNLSTDSPVNVLRKCVAVAAAATTAAAAVKQRWQQ